MNAHDKPIGPAIARIGKRFSEDTLVVFVVLALFAAACGYLFITVDSGLDPNLGKNWWTLSFETRDPASGTFTIENHSKATRFTYTLTENKQSLDSGTVTIAKGDKKTVTPNVSLSPGRTIITVKADDNSMKEIYRER
ncbi:MAG: hypothetical protein WCL23_04970 [Candidatus Moraniibacteriota bacterium]